MLSDSDESANWMKLLSVDSNIREINCCFTGWRFDVSYELAQIDGCIVVARLLSLKTSSINELCGNHFFRVCFNRNDIQALPS